MQKSLQNNLEKTLKTKLNFLQDLEVKNRLALTSPQATKDYLQEVLQVFNNAFLNSADIKHLIYARAFLVDKLLEKLWQKFELESDQVALFATGGYGRGELHPYSDLDLVFFVPDKLSTAKEEKLRSFINRLWDLDLQIGHNLVFKKDINNLAQNTSIFTAWLEARQLSSGKNYLTSFVQEVQKSKNFSDFLSEKIHEQKERHKKFSTPFYLLEPNIKNSSGALRSIHTINWIFFKLTGISLFNLNENSYAKSSLLKKLAKLDFFKKENLLKFAQELDFLRCGLWQIRYALHSLNDRNEDRILFDYQTQLAKTLGFNKYPNQHKQQNFAEILLMQNYFAITQKIEFLTQIFLQNFTSDFEQKLHTQIEQKLEFKPIDEFIYLNAHRELEITSGALTKNAGLFLSAFKAISFGYAENLSPTTSMYFLHKKNFINKNVLENPANQQAFLAIFSGKFLFKTLKIMSLSGFLGEYIKDFKRLSGLMQYDLAHIYSVDWHLLHTVKNLEFFSDAKAMQEFPLARQIIAKTPKKNLLYLAGFFHDIGKGLGGSHAIKGKQIFLKFAKRHSSFLDEKSIELVSFLIEEHLLMSETAQKQDLSEIKFIAAFVDKVKTQTRLDYLYLLTVADISATNPKLWNTWRGALLKQLYWSAQEFLLNGKLMLDLDQQIDVAKTQTLKLLTKQGIATKDALNLWRELGEDYFVNLHAEQAFWQTYGILNHLKTAENFNKPLALIEEPKDEIHQTGTRIFVYTDDQPNIFANTVNCLQSLNLNVLEARITTGANAKVLDSFVVLEKSGEPPKVKWRLAEIKIQLLEALKLNEPLKISAKRHIWRREKHYQTQSKIKLNFDKNINKFVLEIKTKDRVGLLAEIASILLKYNLNLHHAKITTLADKVEDVFYLSNKSVFNHKQQKKFITDVAQKLDTVELS